MKNRLADVLLAACLSGIAFAIAACGAQDTFTILMLPDTQFYSEKYNDLFDSQTRWIADRVRQENIVFVTHVGDIVQSGDQRPEEWAVAQGAMSRLDGLVPYAVVPGNHDFDVGEPLGRATSFLKFFGPDRFRAQEWFAGSSANGLNSYQIFQGAGREFLILHLEADVPDSAIEWARTVLSEHPNTPTIVSTHIYRDDVTRARTTAPYYRTDAGNSGEDLWRKLIRKHAQIFLVPCGHWSTAGGEWFQVSTNDAGQDVFEILADFQTREQGGNAWLRTLRFQLSEGRVDVRTYSPHLDRWEGDSNSEFTFYVPFNSRFLEAPR